MTTNARVLLVFTLTLIAALLVLADTGHARSWRAELAPLLHPCLVALVDRENPGWDPTRYNRQGSGAYGLPQALPGHKMAKAGRDWRWNPVTQLRWMVMYANGRYGGVCEALAFQKRRGYY